MISARPPGPLHLLPFPNPEGSLRTPPTSSLCVCLCSRGYSTGAHTESLDSQCEAHTASPPGPPVLLWPHTENSTLRLPHAPQSLFADLLPLHSSTPGPDLSSFSLYPCTISSLHPWVQSYGYKKVSQTNHHMPRMFPWLLATTKDTLAVHNPVPYYHLRQAL